MKDGMRGSKVQKPPDRRETWMRTTRFTRTSGFHFYCTSVLYLSV